MNYPTNTDDLIDSRDVIEALEDLAQLHQAGPAELAGELDGIPASEWDQDALFDHESLLVTLQEQAADYTDWTDGATLIRDSYFKEYAQELANDLDYDMPDASHWPYTCMSIDWEQAARELQQDYTSVDFNGVTYWVR